MKPMNYELLAKHYKGRERIAACEAEYEKRQWLIWLVVLGLKSLRKDTEAGSATDNVPSLTLDCELMINKLKLELSSQSIALGAKISLLKEENTKLKAKVMAFEKATPKPLSVLRHNSILLRLGKRPISIEDSPFVDRPRNLIFTPTTPQTDTPAMPNILGRDSPPKPAYADSTFVSCTPFRHISASTPYKQLPSGGFSDASTTDHSPSSELLRRQGKPSTAATQSTDEDYDSASSSTNKRKRKNNLKLGKAARQFSQPALDKDGVNNADYYTDAHVLTEPPEPPTKTTATSLQRPQKRNKIFTID